MGKFQKNNKLAKGGKRPGAGRPTREQKKIKQAVAEIVQAYIEKHIEPILKAYLELAGGREVKHYNQQTGAHIYTEFEVDGPTLRHWIDKVLPAAKQEIDIKHGGTVIIRTIDPDDDRGRKRKV